MLIRRTRSHRQRKPEGPVEIDWHNDLASGLKHFWLFNEGAGLVRDLVGENNGSLQANAFWRVVKDGRSVKLDGADDYVYCGTMNDCRAEPLTAIFGGSGGTGQSVSAVCATPRASGGANGWGLNWEQYNNTGKIGFTKYGVVGISSALTTPAGYAVIGASVTTSNVIFGKNGATDTKSSSTSIVDNSNQRFDIGGVYRAGSGMIDEFSGDLSFLMLFEEAKTAEGMAVLTGEPLQLLKPRTSKIYLPSAGAGVTLDPMDLVGQGIMDAGVLDQTHQLAALDLAAAGDLPNITATQTHETAPADLTGAAALDAGQLTQTHEMAAIDLAGLGVLSEITIGQGVLLDPMDLAAAGVIENGSLAQTHQLDPADLTGAASLPGISLPPRQNLEALDLVGAGVMDAGALSQTHQLDPAAIAAANDLAPAAFTQTHGLAGFDLVGLGFLPTGLINTKLLGPISDPSILSLSVLRTLASRTPNRSTHSLEN